MEYSVFGDESGTTGNDKSYSIGLLCVPRESVSNFNDYIHQLKAKRGISGELKWSKIKNSARQANICIDLLNMVMKSQCCFHAIVVKKDVYRNWAEKTERHHAFYKTYTELIKSVAQHTNSTLTINMDQKSDKYKKHDEVTGIIANNMLEKMGKERLVEYVKMQDSKEYLGLQAVDILTGAVNSGYLKFLDPNLKLSVAKEVAFQRMAQMIGWDKFHHDTYPNPNFNIWHFPEQIRGNAGTKAVAFNPNVKAVKPEELKS